MVQGVKWRWDERTTVCVKEGCDNPRGTTSEGVTSLSCQPHTDEWEQRMANLAAGLRMDGQPRKRPRYTSPITPPFTPPRPVLSDEEMCVRCHQAVRNFPDRLCEECRG